MANGLADRKLFSKHNHPIDHLTEGAALLSGIALFPQVFKIFETKHVGDLAPSTFFILVISNAVWIAYGVHRRSLPLLISGSLNFVASGLILAMFFLFKT